MLKLLSTEQLAKQLADRIYMVYRLDLPTDQDFRPFFYDNLGQKKIIDGVGCAFRFKKRVDNYSTDPSISDIVASISDIDVINVPAITQGWVHEWRKNGEGFWRERLVIKVM